MLRHRGPDGTGAWMSTDGRCWLGHTRLSILDLSATGAQPMQHNRLPVHIVFNGEIYNHHQLRGVFGSGEIWRGTSDTETLLAGFVRWRAELLPRLKGMFAFVIFDESSGTLFAARDRFGMKPLYYSRRGDGFRFASEVRSLLHEECAAIQPDRVARFLQCGACPDDGLLFTGIHALLPGHSITISAGGQTQVRCYWPGPGAIRSDSREALPRVRDLLERAVDQHLLADVPVASFLSGGIDSTVVTALAARRSRVPLRTFSVGFPQREWDETSVAAEVAARFRTQHERIEVSEQEAVSLVQEAVERMDLPSVDAVNTYIVSRQVARAGIKVALSGLGGDELFGGYPIFHEVAKLQRLSPLAKSFRAALVLFGDRGRRMAEIPSESVSQIVLWRRRFWTDAMLHSAGLPAPSLIEIPAWDLPDTFAEVSWAELQGYLRHMLLRDADQMSMAVSLELRVPFLDHELVEYVLGLPAAVKARSNCVKSLLVGACADLLPRSVFDRPKQGFALPMDHWMRGPLAEFVQAGLACVRGLELIDGRFLNQLELRFKFRRLHWTRLWSLVVLGHYLRRVKSVAAQSCPMRDENTHPLRTA
ncbi:MAG: asparagine synthase (glutamine-hydrolyzing) [Verrucomicrobiales bacterium]|nr:asparagine synthase (glutamine-hydrolyzing) [Verrucomicrobiales bacterium]